MGQRPVSQRTRHQYENGPETRFVCEINFLCRTLAITQITAQDEAIYQCIAENSAGTNQASARLAIIEGPELPEAPTGLQASALSSTSLQLIWDQPPEHVSQQIIGYVLHIRRLGGKGRQVQRDLFVLMLPLTYDL